MPTYGFAQAPYKWVNADSKKKTRSRAPLDDPPLLGTKKKMLTINGTEGNIVGIQHKEKKYKDLVEDLQLANEYASIHAKH